MTLFALGNLLTLDSDEATNDDPLRSDGYTFRQTNIAMENDEHEAFEDVFHIQHEEFSRQFTRGYKVCFETMVIVMSHKCF